MPELVGFQTMVILDPYGMTFDAVGVFGLVFWLLFKSGSSYCDRDITQSQNNCLCFASEWGHFGTQYFVMQAEFPFSMPKNISRPVTGL